MEPTEQLAHILPTLSSTVDRIQVEQLSHPTPCDNFSVHDVLNHMIVGGGTFAYMFRGEQPPEITAPETDSVPAAEFRRAMDDLLAAVRFDGALERTIAAPFGDLPGSTFARFVAFDGLMHGWDLARATGIAFEVPGDVVAAVDEFAHVALTDDLRDGDTFKDPTIPPADADVIEHLAAFSGRTVQPAIQTSH
jgi:uncharacterized protein (TIGR03086 family)